MYADEVSQILSFLERQDSCDRYRIQHVADTEFLPMNKGTIVLVAPKNVVLECVSEDLFPHLVGISALEKPVNERKSALENFGSKRRITLDAINDILLTFHDGQDISGTGLTILFILF
jgi:hypothetical protein